MTSKQVSTPKIAFIGAGNMANAILGGLVATGYPAQNITATASSLDSEKLQAAKRDHGVEITAANIEAVSDAEVIVLSVKPQKLKSVCEELAGCAPSNAVFVSVAAGVSAESLGQWLGADRSIVRCMPNTPSLVGVGASGLFANANTSTDQKQICERIMGSVGVVVWLEKEDQIDAVTAVSGSGPAYYFYVLEAVIAEGIRQGLTPEVARTLAIETALGAATLAKDSVDGPDVLRKRVTSPGGTTEQAIFSFDRSGLADVFSKAMVACAERSRAMAEEFK